jgi:raffinose/stachyose/melibiose transport system substrate-binding protein
MVPGLCPDLLHARNGEMAERFGCCLRGARFPTQDASQKQLQQKDVVHMAIADNPISRRNFLYGMVGTGAALTIGRRVAASGRLEVPDAAKSAPSGTLTFMSWDSAEVMTPAIKAFEAQYPKVSVQPSYVPPVTQYISTLEERLLAGTAPDVFIYTDEDEAALNSHHLVRDLSDQPWVKYLATANRDFASTQGRVWGLSVTSWTAGPIYNVPILNKAGYNQPPSTWADFLKFCDTVKGMNLTPVYDTAVPGPGAILIGQIGGYYKRRYGKNIDSELLTGKISFVDAWTEPLTAYYQLYQQGLVDTAYLGLTGTEIDTLMAEGKLGVYASGPWDVATIRGVNPSLQMLMGPAPGPSAGQGYWTGSPNVAWAVNAKAKNPEAALAFLSFMASPNGLKPYVAKQGYPSAMSNYSPPVPSVLTLAAAAARTSNYYFYATSWANVDPKIEPHLATELSADLESMIQGKLTVHGVLRALDSQLATLRKSS